MFGNSASVQCRMGMIIAAQCVCGASTEGLVWLVRTCSGARSRFIEHADGHSTSWCTDHYVFLEIRDARETFRNVVKYFLLNELTLNVILEIWVLVRWVIVRCHVGTVWSRFWHSPPVVDRVQRGYFITLRLGFVSLKLWSLIMAASYWLRMNTDAKGFQ